ncbi:hypothetical protein HMPREF0658_0649 [Hoylesella marshii DSM 16973 = JCM 13450]|uniref:Uncharacterized protein n=1 Tax=Hoylesella marshii DSM 16973 = JCM 13450 TaxID=862515 RepID=E0NR48_9BACT|nr:hypothetical protein HMPREF0658_0649 [Hoylesella marshii DSM 16973 = JCM 13450]
MVSRKKFAGEQKTARSLRPLFSLFAEAISTRCKMRRARVRNKEI